MAKELMEIGGFITEGAEIVNHDNTLSGNGTVESPLGVLPGYNETVLMEIEKASAPSAFTVSEPMKNFNRIGFYAVGYGSTPIYYESPAPTGNENVSIIFNYYCQADDNNPYQIRMSRYGTTNGTNYTWIDGKFIYYNMASLTAVGGTTGHKGPLYKIIGINRKQ